MRCRKEWPVEFPESSMTSISRRIQIKQHARVATVPYNENKPYCLLRIGLGKDHAVHELHGWALAGGFSGAGGGGGHGRRSGRAVGPRFSRVQQQQLQLRQSGRQPDQPPVAAGVLHPQRQRVPIQPPPEPLLREPSGLGRARVSFSRRPGVYRDAVDPGQTHGGVFLQGAVLVSSTQPGRPRTLSRWSRL